MSEMFLHFSFFLKMMNKDEGNFSKNITKKNPSY